VRECLCVEEVAAIKRLLSNGFVIAVLATSAVLFVLRWLKPLTGGNPPLLLFLMAVMLAAWYGAIRAGLLATALSALNSVFFLQVPFDPFIAPPGARLQMLLLDGLSDHAADQQAAANRGPGAGSVG
jgi:hypothetical protein